MHDMLQDQAPPEDPLEVPACTKHSTLHCKLHAALRLWFCRQSLVFALAPGAASPGTFIDADDLGESVGECCSLSPLNQLTPIWQR
mmetsp:Transcript_68130/g.134479  ORF Transcript_68130/g.134479 Transcript_68130/m.134479 type:complete len:86 (+) Transcript_68130:85-342(+)